MTDIILVVILLLIVGSAIFYIKKEKQRDFVFIKSEQPFLRSLRDIKYRAPLLLW